MKMFDFKTSLLPEQNKSFSGTALAERVELIRENLRNETPQELASRTGADFFFNSSPGRSFFKLFFLGQELVVDFPSFTVFAPDSSEMPLIVQALVMYYYSTANGHSLNENWVSFSDLPDGRIYAQAFQGYSGDRLLRELGSGVDKFRKSCLAVNGTAYPMADAAFLFHALPRFPMLLVYWQGDEEFSSASKVLFDSGSRNYLPIDGCAIIGSMLVSNVLHAGKQQ